MHHISKNWERVFDFQYKVVSGQCEPGQAAVYECRAFRPLKLSANYLTLVDAKNSELD